MTSADNGATIEPESGALTREEAQRRLEELLEQSGGDQDERSKRRRRALLIFILILLLLLLCAIGAFLYRLLAPRTDASSDETGGVIWIRSIYGFGPAADQQFVNPNDAVTAPDGTIWISDPTNSRIVGFRGDGTYVGIMQGSQQTGDPFRLPMRVAVDSNGIAHIADIANETLTIVDGQTRLASAQIPGLKSVAVNDEIIVVGSESGFAVLDKDGNVENIVGTKGSGEDQFDTVGGVAIDSERETIYVVDSYNNRLSAWDYAGKRKWIVTTGNPANDVQLEGGESLVTTTSAPAALQVPADVTVDGKGRPMVLDLFGFSISAFNPENGQFIQTWGEYGEKDGQFMYPSQLSYDPSKDWFLVADTSNRRAQIIRIPGTGPEGLAGVLTGLNRLLAGPLRALWPCLILLPLLLLAALWSRWRKRRREEIEQVEEPELALAESAVEESQL